LSLVRLFRRVRLLGDAEVGQASAEQLGGEFIAMIGKGHFPMAEDPVGFKEYLMPVLDKINRLAP